MTKSNPDLQQTPTHPVTDGGRRRRFLGAGVSAAPLVLTMVSQPALGATCFTPSRSLSRNTSVSQNGYYGECTGAESPGNYKAQQTPGTSAYHWPASVKPTDPFHPTFKMGTVQGVSKFTKYVNGQWVSKSFGEALNIEASGQVHFHLIGAYLNKLGGNGAVIPDVAITVEGLLNIWSEYITKGYYEPTAGVRWDAEDIKTYLVSNGIVK
jgi:hypothetical protein